MALKPLPSSFSDIYTDIHQPEIPDLLYHVPFRFIIGYGVVSHGARSIWGDSGFTDHTRKNKRKTNAFTIFAHREVFLKLPKFSPCRDQDGAGSGISDVYLWI